MSFGQGGPSWGPGDTGPRGPQGPREPRDGRFPRSGPATPDWSALAEAAAARERRRKWLWVGGGAVATVVVASLVAAVVVTANHDDGERADARPRGLPPTQTLPSETAKPSPTFPSVAPKPVPKPTEYLNSAAKDTAPLPAAGLFPGTEVTIGSAVYKKGALASTTDCASATQGALGGVLSANGCRRLMRATYTKDGTAVTVGVAVFDTDAAALRAKQQARGNVASLPGAGVPVFCRAVKCRNTTNAVGRYLYVTVGGFTAREDVTPRDTAVFRAGDDLSTFAFRQIYRRGVAAASAAATAPAA
ncbi:hypothetical protein [Streptomyces sp. NPDC007088]|uniref:hypothetical protein n=1 Tax=Streptomyces sp. NPDC007088 TaxID=3364773 RepID=UPI0036A6E01D